MRCIFFFFCTAFCDDPLFFFFLFPLLYFFLFYLLADSAPIASFPSLQRANKCRESVLALRHTHSHTENTYESDAHRHTHTHTHTHLKKKSTDCFEAFNGVTFSTKSHTQNLNPCLLPRLTVFCLYFCKYNCLTVLVHFFLCVYLLACLFNANFVSPRFGAP